MGRHLPKVTWATLLVLLATGSVSAAIMVHMANMTSVEEPAAVMFFVSAAFAMLASLPHLVLGVTAVLCRSSRLAGTILLVAALVIGAAGALTLADGFLFAIYKLTGHLMVSADPRSPLLFFQTVVIQVAASVVAILPAVWAKYR